MENTLFFLLCYQGNLNHFQQNTEYHYHLEYLLSFPIYSLKDLDDHATFQFRHKVEIHS